MVKAAAPCRTSIPNPPIARPPCASVCSIKLCVPGGTPYRKPLPLLETVRPQSRVIHRHSATSQLRCSSQSATHPSQQLRQVFSQSIANSGRNFQIGQHHLGFLDVRLTTITSAPSEPVHTLLPAPRRPRLIQLLSLPDKCNSMRFQVIN